MPSMTAFTPSITADGTNVTYVPDGKAVIEQLPLVADFSFTIVADGGYEDANISFAENQVDIESWIEYGLGRHIQIHDDDLVLIWEGFVNQVSVSLGPLSISRGPLNAIANRVTAKYAMSEIVGNEIVATADLSTTTTDDEYSKLKYGIFEKIIDVGSVWDATEAAKYMNMHIAAYSLPETAKQFSNQGQGLGLSIQCLGYYHFFKNYIYDEIAVGVDNISVEITNATDNGKMQLAIAADPNGLFTVANSDLYTNGITVPQWDDQDSDAWTVIQTLVIAGDDTADYGRTIFGVYAGRKIIYAQVPTEFEYRQALSDPGQKVTTMEGGEVKPWNVLPGKWLLFTDFLTDKITPSNLRKDQRAMFIERVVYSSPYGLQLDGGKMYSVKQALAAKGLGM